MNDLLKYNITRDNGTPSSVTVFIPGKAPLIASAEHPKFGEICTTVQQPSLAADIESLFDQTSAVIKHFDRLSDRMTWSHGRLFFDGDEMHSVIGAEILRLMALPGDNWKALVNFVEKIEMNPNEHSKANLFAWLEKHSYSIDPDGDFYAYKYLDSGGLSQHGGRAIVNGEVHNGRIPNPDGAIIEMPRADVQHDPHNGCSTGLHVANWNFVAHASVKKLIKVNPRDVVSVPTDSGGAKMRVCKYVVIKTVTEENKAVLISTAARTARTVGVADPNGLAVVGHDADTAGASVPAKRRAAKPARKAAAPPVAPKLPTHDDGNVYYELFAARDFRKLPKAELRWLAGEWNIVGRSKLTDSGLIQALVKEARERKTTW